ncbi:hypothetical protein ACFLZQ_05015 [Thermodesulfobacteriota bacterium]
MNKPKLSILVPKMIEISAPFIVAVVELEFHAAHDSLRSIARYRDYTHCRIQLDGCKL